MCLSGAPSRELGVRHFASDGTRCGTSFSVSRNPGLTPERRSIANNLLLRSFMSGFLCRAYSILLRLRRNDLGEYKVHKYIFLLSILCLSCLSCVWSLEVRPCHINHDYCPRSRLSICPVVRCASSVVLPWCCFVGGQADYDARAVGRRLPSQDHRDIRLLSPGAVEDEDNVTGLLRVRETAMAWWCCDVM